MAAPTQSGSAALSYMPSLSLLVLTLLSLIEWPIPFISPETPSFAVLGIVFFTFWQPRYMPYGTVFACGLLYDALPLGVFGTHALLFMLLRLVVERVRLKTGFVEAPLMASCYMLPVMVLYFVLTWGLVSLLAGHASLSWEWLERDILTLICYPLVHMGLSYLVASVQSRH